MDRCSSLSCVVVMVRLVEWLIMLLDCELKCDRLSITEQLTSILASDIRAYTFLWCELNRIFLYCMGVLSAVICQDGWQFLDM